MHVDYLSMSGKVYRCANPVWKAAPRFVVGAATIAFSLRHSATKVKISFT